MKKFHSTAMAGLVVLVIATVAAALLQMSVRRAARPEQPAVTITASAVVIEK